MTDVQHCIVDFEKNICTHMYLFTKIKKPKTLFNIIFKETDLKNIKISSECRRSIFLVGKLIHKHFSEHHSQIVFDDIYSQPFEDNSTPNKTTENQNLVQLYDKNNGTKDENKRLVDISNNFQLETNDKINDHSANNVNLMNELLDYLIQRPEIQNLCRNISNFISEYKSMNKEICAEYIFESVRICIKASLFKMLSKTIQIHGNKEIEDRLENIAKIESQNKQMKQEIEIMNETIKRCYRTMSIMLGIDKLESKNSP